MRQIIIFFISVLFFGCATTKYKKQGFVSQNSYIYEVPFDFINDLIFIPVVIENKKYNFIFDTGAELNVINPLIANELNIKKLKKGLISDGTDSNKGVSIVEIDNIKIGNLQFKETAGMVWDLSKLSNLVGCVKIDGIIGNNLMRKSNWQINYKDKTIKFSDNPKNFYVSNNAKKVIMNSKNYGNVLFDIAINDKVKKFTFDTGFNGFMQTSVMDFLENKKYITTIGLSGGNYNGKKDGEINYCHIKSFNLNGIEFNCPSIFNVKPNNSSLLGNEFFKNFILTIDWENDFLYFDPQNEIEYKKLEMFEISLYPDYGKNEIYISNIFKGSNLLNKISPHSKVLYINDYDVSSFQNNELCDFWENEWKILKKHDRLNITIKTNDESNIEKIIVEKIKNFE